MEPGNQLLTDGGSESDTGNCQASSRSIPTSLTPFFQEYDLESLDLVSSAGTIIPRVLQFGDREEIRWLFSVYSRQSISAWIIQWGGIALPEPHRTFWYLVLGSGEGGL
jgi:hypothetical protein